MSSLLVNNNKVSGLVSGLDSDTIIKGLLSSYQTKIDKVEQDITKDQWVEDSYREVNTQIKNFRSKYLSVMSDSNMMSDSIYNAHKISMTTNSSAMTLAASSSALPGSMTIDSISQLATAAAFKSTGAYTGTTFNNNTKLQDLQLANGLVFDGTDKISFKINNISFSFGKDTTIGSMMTEINTSDAGVKMSYSALTKGFIIQSKQSGSASSIVISNTTGNAFSSSGSAFGISEGTAAGQDAVCSINGISVTQSSNTFSYDGITYTLNDISGSAIKFNVVQDIDAPVQKIKDFVSSYNDLVDKLQSKVGEKYDSDYPPLTEAQKNEMSDDEISKWTDKAKTGLLHNDTYVTTLLSTLRNALYSKIESAGMSPSDIGINTGTYSDGAKITLNESSLRTAFAKDPDKVNSIFVAGGTDSDSQGLIVRISNAMLSYTKQTTNVALSDLEKKVTSLKDKKDTISDKMDSKQLELYNKFSNMEAALSKLNSMSSWINSFFPSSS